MPDRVLNPEQKKAVEHGEGPLLIIAGAGTGKTTVITERVKHLILDKKVLPQNILALTFTEKAALEMESRVDAILPYGYTQMWIQTFHSFCDRILRNEAVHIGLNPSFQLLTEAEALQFLKKHFFTFQLSYFRPLGNPMKFLQGMLQHFSRLRDDDISPEEYLRYSQKFKRQDAKLSNDEDEIKKTLELANAFKKYEDLKARESVMDFSDLISNTLKLLRTRKNILKQYQEQFQYILVDEFQDTNFAQNEMAILLAGKKKNITVVGDDDQSIYRWRGAAIANMMQFRSHFPNATMVTLTKNYRSTQTILDSAYQLITNNNPDRLEVKEKIDKKLSGLRGIAGKPIELLFGERAEDEADLIVKKIKHEVEENQRKYSDFAILVRANDHSLPFQRALQRAKMPFQFLGPSRLFQQDEIKDLIAYLRVLANFEDSSALYRVLTMPIFAFEGRDIAAMVNAAKRKNVSLFQAIEEPGDITVVDEVKEKLQTLAAMLHRHLARVPKETAGQILYFFFEDSGLLGHYLDPGSARTEREAQNVAKFFDKLQNYASHHDDASVFAVVDWIELAMELGESPLATEADWTNTNAVNILTVHSSKGLEFPVVFVVNLVTQRFPSRDRKEQIPVPKDLIKEELPEGDANMQEERRLFYVAMTRAKDALYLTSAKSYGDVQRERKISPFVIEALGEKYVTDVLQKQKVTESAQQLSLLDVLAPMAEEEHKKEINALPVTRESTPISYLSYSQLQTFSICPLHYKLRYIMRLPAAPSAALSFGITMHALLKAIYQQGFKDTLLPDEKIKDLVAKNWVTEGYENREHNDQAKANAVVLLKEYMLANSKGKTPDHTELSFQFFLNKVKILGRFDRIDIHNDGKLEIIDYKTGSNVPTEKKLASDLQLTIYALAATQINGPLFTKRPEDIILTLYYLEQNKRLTTSRTKEQLEEARSLILQKIDEIQQSDFHCSGSMLCNNCEYKMLCKG